uniref:Secreted protein n=1 Tax=Mycena chlorophos TaxID=658473 RepID=A0ABQ0LHE7_MYCCL|nr:predicted protein [Mycena chlorophos]
MYHCLRLYPLTLFDAIVVLSFVRRSGRCTRIRRLAFSRLRQQPLRHEVSSQPNHPSSFQPREMRFVLDQPQDDDDEELTRSKDDRENAPPR